MYICIKKKLFVEYLIITNNIDKQFISNLLWFITEDVSLHKYNAAYTLILIHISLFLPLFYAVWENSWSESLRRKTNHFIWGPPIPHECFPILSVDRTNLQFPRKLLERSYDSMYYLPFALGFVCVFMRDSIPIDIHTYICTYVVRFRWLQTEFIGRKKKREQQVI